MSDLLARIDDLTAPTGRCRSCDGDLHGAVSEDFCGEVCQVRWARRGIEDAPPTAAELAAYLQVVADRQITGMRALVEQMQPVFAGMADAIRQCAEVARKVQARTIIASGNTPPPPADPMAAALHARRHRNTGPKVHADPRLNR